MSNQIIKHMWTEEELWDGSQSIFHLLFFLFSQIYNLSVYHLLLPSCALASYHPLLTTWTSKFDRTPRGPRYLRRVDIQTDKRASQLIAKMPNNSDARRNKREKKKKGRGETSPSPPQQVTEESVESLLSRSASDSGFQGENDEVTWESAAGEAAWDNSLSSFRRETVKEEKKRARKEALEMELEDESDVDLTDEEGSKAKDPSPRKISLSPT
jgi:hypothetical protein